MPVNTPATRRKPSLSDHRETFEGLCAWIEAHLDEPIGWQELMAESGLDHQTLNALFYKFQSTTPMAWIRQRRSQVQPHVRAIPRSVSVAHSH